MPYVDKEPPRPELKDRNFLGWIVLESMVADNIEWSYSAPGYYTWVVLCTEFTKNFMVDFKCHNPMDTEYSNGRIIVAQAYSFQPVLGLIWGCGWPMEFTNFDGKVKEWKLSAYFRDPRQERDIEQDAIFVLYDDYDPVRGPIWTE